jgi:hypothetical protein
MQRLLDASRAAAATFKRVWNDYDRVVAERYVKKVEEKQQEVTAAYSMLSPSDQHFLQTYMNNLPMGGKRPEREATERFVSIVKSMPKEAQAEIAKKAVEVCPALLVTKAFASYLRGN